MPDPPEALHRAPLLLSSGRSIERLHAHATIGASDGKGDDSMGQARHEPDSCLDLMTAANRVAHDAAASTAAKLCARALLKALGASWGGTLDSELDRAMFEAGVATLRKVSTL